MPRPRNYAYPTGDENVERIRNHLINNGACSPDNAEAALARAGLNYVDPADVPDIMLDPTGGNVVIARRLCAVCPLVNYCLEYAVSYPAVATDGIWGSLDPHERSKLRRRRRDQARRGTTPRGAYKTRNVSSGASAMV